MGPPSSGLRCCWALAALALLSACKNKPGQPEPVSPGAPVAAVDAGWALTLPMLDGYLGYQRTLLVQAGKLAPPPWDGGLKKFEESKVAQRADLDERARARAGLTADDVLKIEAMLSQAAARRLTLRMMRVGDKMPDLPAADPNEPGASEIEAAMASQAKLKKSLQELPEERKAFGSRNIDVLLQREEELLKNWALMMEVPELAEGRR